MKNPRSPPGIVDFEGNKKCNTEFKNSEIAPINWTLGGDRKARSPPEMGDCGIDSIWNTGQANMDLWIPALAWSADQGLGATKVTSHQDQKGRDHTGTVAALFANAAADALADKAAEKVAPPPSLTSRVRSTDALARAVLHRLCAIEKLCQETGDRAEGEDTATSAKARESWAASLLQKVAVSGHHFEAWSTKRKLRVRCVLCGLCGGARTMQAWLAKGKWCKKAQAAQRPEQERREPEVAAGMEVAEDAVGLNAGVIDEAEGRRPTREALMAALISFPMHGSSSSSSRAAPQLSSRSVVEATLGRAHHTHQLAKCVASGSYICLRCGAMTAGAVMCKLAQPCQKPTKSGLRELARIAKGQGLRVGDRHRKA